MCTNIERIETIIDYIESHLEEELSLSRLSAESNYSKYHLHRMFSSIVGFPIHVYVQRRRLTEAARLLLTTKQPIIDIALVSGYTTQQSFNEGFKKLYHKPPNAYRKNSTFHPIQLKFEVTNQRNSLRADRTLDVHIIKHQEIQVVAYRVNTKYGFITIPKVWRKLQKVAHLIPNRSKPGLQIGIHEYVTDFACNIEQPTFDYYAGVEVSHIQETPRGMVGKIIPTSKYVVFSMRGNNKDSMQPVLEYIYQTWFPASTCIFNEELRCDLIMYSEHVDEKKESDIAVWIPIK